VRETRQTHTNSAKPIPGTTPQIVIVKKRKEKEKPMSALDLAVQRRKQVELVERGLADPSTLKRPLNDQDISAAAEKIEDNIIENALDGVIEEVELYLNSALLVEEGDKRDKVMDLCIRLWMNDESLTEVLLDSKLKPAVGDDEDEDEDEDGEEEEEEEEEEDEGAQLDDVDLGFGDAGAVAIADAMRSNSSVTSVVIRNQAVGDEGCAALALALSGNSSVTNLDLSMNHICNVGAAEIAKMMRRNDTVERIDLRSNLIGDFGTRKLMLGLRKNTKVENRKLKLRSNRVSVKQMFVKREVNLKLGFSKTRTLIEKSRAKMTIHNLHF
jgi:hypothetical protein